MVPPQNMVADMSRDPAMKKKSPVAQNEISSKGHDYKIYVDHYCFF